MRLLSCLVEELKPDARKVNMFHLMEHIPSTSGSSKWECPHQGTRYWMLTGKHARFLWLPAEFVWVFNLQKSRACATGNVAALVPTSLTAIPDLVNCIRKPLAFSHLPALTGAIEKAMSQFGLKKLSQFPATIGRWSIDPLLPGHRIYYHLVV